MMLPPSYCRDRVGGQPVAGAIPFQQSPMIFTVPRRCGRLSQIAPWMGIIESFIVVIFLLS